MLGAMMRQRRGLTLPELLVAVAVMAILIAVAAPSFRGMIEVQRLRSINSQLITDLQFARNEAVTRGLPLRVVFSGNLANPPTCYVLFTSVGAPGDPDPHAANKLRCNCLAGPGNACTGLVGTSEIRTASIAPSSGVSVLQAGAENAIAFDPVTGGLLSIPMDRDGAPMLAFRVASWLDASRHLINVLNQSGRPTVCSPAGTTLGEAACAP
jgi:type IV fimbrial biogenesis protein FimT